MRPLLLFALLPAVSVAQTPVQPPAPSAPLARADLLRQIDARFRRMDADGDGLLSGGELDKAEAAAGRQFQAVRAKQRAAVFTRLDANRDGVLSRAEFDAGDRVRLVAEGSAKALTKLDTSGDGRISAVEMQRPALARFNRLDANKDGVLQPSERRRGEGFPE